MNNTPDVNNNLQLTTNNLKHPQSTSIPVTNESQELMLIVDVSTTSCAVLPTMSRSETKFPLYIPGPGIYRIVNMRTGMIYYGESDNVSWRIGVHVKYLNKKGKHSNKYLYADWLKYGCDAFKFEILAYGPFFKEKKARNKFEK